MSMDSSTNLLVNSNNGPLTGKSAVISPIEVVTDLRRYLAWTWKKEMLIIHHNTLPTTKYATIVTPGLARNIALPPERNSPLWVSAFMNMLVIFGTYTPRTDEKPIMLTWRSVSVCLG